MIPNEADEVEKEAKYFLESATSIALAAGIRRSILNHNIIKLHPEYEICRYVAQVSDQKNINIYYVHLLL